MAKPGPKPKPLVCRECGEDDVNELVKRSSGKIDRLCRTCARAKSRADYRAAPDYYRTKQQLKRAANPEKTNAHGRENMRRMQRRQVDTAWIGRAVRDWRKANGLTIAHAAALLEIGVYAYTYREQGHRRYKPAELRRIAELGINVWQDQEVAA